MYARSLSRLALVFVLLYVLLVVSAAFPPRLLDYDWINRVTAALINGSSMPLLALLVLVVGNQLYPENKLLYQRRQLFSRLAGLAVVGFLLLIPLHIFMGLWLQTGTSEQVRVLDVSERQLDSYREAANKATSVADLRARFEKLNAPAINSDVLSRPFPEVKAQTLAALKQVAVQLAQQRQALSAQNSWTVRAPEVLRIDLACLVLAFGFASFTQPTPTGPLLIDRLEEALARSRRASLLRSGEPGRQAGMAHSLGNLLQPLQKELKARSWRQRRQTMRNQGIAAARAASSSAQGGKRSPWWARLFAISGLQPAKIRKAKGASKLRQREYIKAILSEESHDSKDS